MTPGPEPQQAASRALNGSAKVPAPQKASLLFCTLLREPLKLRSHCQQCILRYILLSKEGTEDLITEQRKLGNTDTTSPLQSREKSGRGNWNC